MNTLATYNVTNALMTQIGELKQLVHETGTIVADSVSLGGLAFMAGRVSGDDSVTGGSVTPGDRGLVVGETKAGCGNNNLVRHSNDSASSTDGAEKQNDSRLVDKPNTETTAEDKCPLLLPHAVPDCPEEGLVRVERPSSSPSDNERNRRDTKETCVQGEDDDAHVAIDVVADVIVRSLPTSPRGGE